MPNTMAMLAQLLLSTAMVIVTVAIHGFGLAMMVRVLRVEALAESQQHVPALSARALAFTLAMVLALMSLHGVEIWLYAALYRGLDAVSDLETAVYFSTISYAAIGYGDSHIVRAWRLLGAIEGINGVVLLGWSTAFFVTMVTRVGRR